MEQAIKVDDLNVTLPEVEDNLPQNEEFCWVSLNGKREKINFHDYGRIYSIPGLYEYLFYNNLKCQSPVVVCTGLKWEMSKHIYLHRLKGNGRVPVDAKELKVLELGAGNGIMGEHLKEMGVSKLLGIDIIKEAKEAAFRDRPHVYDDYLVMDFQKPSPSTYKNLENEEFNCLVSVAALGFGDIPALAFANAFNLIKPKGWVAFNIKEDFLDHRYTHGFSALMHRMLSGTIIERLEQTSYCHRLSLKGERLNYFSIIALKQKDIPIEEWKEILNPS